MHFVFLCTVLWLASSGAAFAQAEAERPAVSFGDDDDPPPILIKRSRPLRLHVELSAMFMPTIVEKYLNHTGGMAAVTLHVHDVFAVEVLGGYTSMREAAVVGGPESVRSQNPDQDPKLPDLVGMSWIAQAGVAFAPIYGKLNFFSEVEVNSQFYLAGGVGAVGAVRRVTTGTKGITPITELTSAGVKFAGNFGFGFKLFFTKWFGIRAEFRDFLYSDYFDYGGTGNAPTIDVIHNFMGLFGLSFIVN